MSKLLLHAEKDIPDFVYKKVNNIINNLDIDNMFLSTHIINHIKNTKKNKTIKTLKHYYTEEQLWDCVYYLKDNPVKPFEVEIELGHKSKVYVTKYVVRIPFDLD